MRIWRRTRHRRGGQTGAIGARIVIGIAVAMIAAVTTATLVDDQAGRRGATRAERGSELAGPSTDRTETTDRPARALLRVGTGNGPVSVAPTTTTAPDAGTGSTGPNDPPTAAVTPGETTMDAAGGPPADDPTTDPASSPSPPPTAPTTMPSSTTPDAAAATATPGPTAPPDPTARFVTRPPGSPLPSGADCAARVRPTPENVPENRTRNQTRGGPVSGTYLADNPSIGANGYEARIDGDFVGTTDEIIQWAACKWGFDEDLIRAQVYAESTWYAGKLGDCGESTVPETRGCASVGLIQVRSAERAGTHHPGLYPMAWRSSALNLDYGLAVKRLCFEGLETWLGQAGDYRAGDQWNCMGRWFSGSWADAGSQDYQARVRDILARRPWETRVGCRDWQTNNHCGG